MNIDYQKWAADLRVIDVWAPGNPTGIVTDKRLYDPTVAGSRAPAKLPGGKGVGGIKHATVGSNSLNYLARGSADDGRWVSIHYLIPKNSTRLPNGLVMDTTKTVFKIVPDGYGANHCYPGTWRGHVNDMNSRFYGVEVENLQNGSDPFLVEQYIKFALVWGYVAAKDRIPDVMLVDHGKVAPPGHRTDPWTGGVWDDALFYGIMWDLRKPENWPSMWGLPLYTGR